MTIIKKYIKFLKENNINEGPRTGRRDLESVDLTQFQFGGEYEFAIPYDKFNETPGNAIERVIGDLEKILSVSIQDGASEYSMSKENSKTLWRMTQDDSVKSNKFEDALPLEFITPVMDYKKFITVTEIIFKYIAKRGFETNGTTGFHVGISYKDEFKTAQIDPLKLVLFSGDKFLKDLWPRVRQELDSGDISTDYVKSNTRILRKILKSVIFYGDNIEQLNSKDLANQVKEWLDKQYRTWIQSGKPEWKSKHQGINIGRLDDGYVEFRVMGGEGYENRLPNVIDNLKRFALTLENSTDDGNKKEYLKKIYKIISTVLDDLEDYDYLGRNDTMPGEHPVNITNEKVKKLFNKAQTLFHKKPKMKEYMYNLAFAFEKHSKEDGILVALNSFENKFGAVAEPALMRSVLAMLMRIYGVNRKDISDAYDKAFFEPGKVPEKLEDEDNASNDWRDYSEGTKTVFKYTKDQLYKLFAL